jgi:hypothetical protein
MPDVHLYSDYWASVLGMPGIVNEKLEKRGLINLNIFRTCLNRPSTRLPGVGYSLLLLLLGPVLIPYRMLQRISSRLHVPLEGEEEAKRLLSPYRLKLDDRDDGRVDVNWRGQSIAKGLIDPSRPDVVFSVVYPAYKVLVAVVLAMGVSLFLHWVERQAFLGESFKTALLLLNYPLLVGLLYLIFRDLLTALVAPLPFFLVVWVAAWIGPIRGGMFYNIPALMAGIAFAYFFVDAFMVPRGMAPTLYLYDNDSDGETFPYQKEEAPTWLEGKKYWVWRFVALTPAEIQKFWERDWERVEVWVRADGESAGQIEWVVIDLHFRELWMPYDRLVKDDRAQGHRAVLDTLLEDRERDVTWVIEVDLNLIAHSPELRGIFILPLKQGWRRARIKQLFHSLRVQTSHDNPKLYEERVRELRMTLPDFAEDIPEHLRNFAIRTLNATPWRYWRYPRGVTEQRKNFLYSGHSDFRNVSSCEPKLQFKADPVIEDSHAKSAQPARMAGAKEPAEGAGT